MWYDIWYMSYLAIQCRIPLRRPHTFVAHALRRATRCHRQPNSSGKLIHWFHRFSHIFTCFHEDLANMFCLKRRNLAARVLHGVIWSSKNVFHLPSQSRWLHGSSVHVYVHMWAINDSNIILLGSWPQDQELQEPASTFPNYIHI